MIKIKYLKKIYLFKKKVSLKKIIKKIKKNKNKLYIAGYTNKKIINLNKKIKKNKKINFISINSYLGYKIIFCIFKYIIKISLKKIFKKNNIIKIKKKNKIISFYIINKNKISKKKKKKIKNKIIHLIKNKNIKDKYSKKIFKKIKILKINLLKKYLFFFKINLISIKKIKKRKIQIIYFKIKKNKNLILNYLNKNKKNTHKYDHRIINKQINLYHINKKTPGMIFWHNKGFILLEKIKKLLRKKNNQYNYIEVQSSSLINKNMWKKSGHWKNYSNFIFSTISEKKKLCIKPMNCLGHIDIYKQEKKTYKNLPIKLSEFGICYRNEYSGSLYGLMRTRSFTQDDAHIFCTKKQIKQEINQCINLTLDTYKIFKLKKNIQIFISTKPKKYLGNIKIWKKLENKLINILKKKKINFKIKKGEGAFYGPKIEFILKDSYNRKWQCGTIQLDFYLPQKLKINYLDKKNILQKPFIIHRAILGSLERFIGILIEKNNGWFPIWLAPIQVVVINISKKHKLYCLNIIKLLKKNNIRWSKDFRNKKINFKIKKHTLQKIPYMIVCGDKEILTNKISVRKFNKFYITDINKLIKKIKKKEQIFKGENY